jgi:bifunctional DNA-binding transcriptional regulator/antitoxin component of YhaV-PrlF toxin-antitoxin module
MTVTFKTKEPLTVPGQTLRRAGIKDGERLQFKVSRRAVTIVPASHDDDDTLTLEEAKRLRRSLKQMRQGKMKPWAQVKDELGL